MSLWIKLHTNFFAHRKTMRLKAAIGEAAYWVPPRLWAYAAESQHDGDFSGYTAEEIASVIGYNGDAQAMLQALLKVEFLDPDLKIHDWAEHAHYHTVHKERAMAAAKARWDKVKEKKKREEEKRGEDRGRTSSNAPSMLEADNPPNSLLRYPKDYKLIIDEITQRRKALKDRYAHESPTGVSWGDNEVQRQEFVRLGKESERLKSEMINLGRSVTPLRKTK